MNTSTHQHINTKEWAMDVVLVGDSKTDSLGYASSLAKFQSVTYESYCKGLRRSLLRTVSECRTSSSTSSTATATANSSSSLIKHQYSHDGFLQHLQRIDWIQLCKFQDADKSALSAGGSKCATKLPLQVLFDLLSDPTIVPPALGAPLLGVAINLIFQSRPASKQRIENSSRTDRTNRTLSRWSLSQQLILNSITTMLATRPSLSLQKAMGDILTSVNIMKEEPTKWHHFISMLHILQLECPRLYLQILHCLIWLVTKLDAQDIEGLRMQQAPSIFAKASASASELHLGTSSEKRKADSGHKNDEHHGGRNKASTTYETFRHLPKKIKVKFTLSELHDEEIVGRHERQLQRGFWSSRKSQHSGISLKSILNNSAKDTDDPRTQQISPNNTMMQSAKNRTAVSTLSQDWNCLRSRCYRKIVACFSSCQSDVAKLHMRSGNRTLIYSESIWQSFMIQLSVTKPDSPAVRLCMAVLAKDDCRSQTASLNIASKCLHLFRNTRNQWYIRIFSEWLVDCSAFDERQLCWNATKMLLDAIKANSFRSETCASLARTSLAYVLSRRISLLMSSADTIQTALYEYANAFAVSFGEAKYWISAAPMAAPTTEATLNALQQLDIISILDSGSHESIHISEPCDPTLEATGSTSHRSNLTADWPFANEFGLRAAAEREQHKVFPKGLLSDLKYDAIGRGVTKNVHRSGDGTDVPRWDLLSMDTLGLIFTFLGAAEVCKSGEVCSMWKQAGKPNWLWHNIYKNFYGMVSSDLLAPEKKFNERDWKFLYLEKEAVEQTIRFQRHKRTGWKYRTCGYIGCLTVMRSPSQQDQHYATHRRKQQRQVEKEAKQKSSNKTKQSRKRKPKTAPPNTG